MLREIILKIKEFFRKIFSRKIRLKHKKQEIGKIKDKLKMRETVTTVVETKKLKKKRTY